MSTLKFVTARLLQELVARTQRLLSSVSGPLSTAALESISGEEVGRVMAQYTDEFRLKTNSDFGMAIAHLANDVAAKMAADIPQDAAYKAARAGAHLVDDAVQQLAFRMAKVLGSQLNELRDTVHTQCAEIVAQTLAKAPSVEKPQAPQPSLEVFTWGRLNEVGYRDDAVRLAREIANVLHTNEMKPYFQNAITTRLDDDNLLITPTNDEDAESEIVLRQLLPKDDPAADKAVRLVTNRAAYREFTDYVRFVLDRPSYEHPIANLVKMAGDVSRHIETLANRNPAVKLSRRVDANVDRVRDMLGLTHAAILCAGTETYSDVLVLTSTDPMKVLVNQGPYNRALKAGLEDADIVNHVKHRSHTGRRVDYTGIRTEDVLVQKDEANTAVAAFESAQVDDAVQSEQDGLTRAVRLTLDAFNREFRSPGLALCDQNALHDKAVDRVAVEVADPNRALHDSVTDYLVQMRGQPSLSLLYTETRQRITQQVAALENNAEMKDDLPAKAFCHALAVVQLDFLRRQMAMH